MSNATQNYTGCLPYTFHVFIPILLNFTYFLGFMLNCISLWIFWFKIKQWNTTVLLQFNLALSDAIITPAAPLIIFYTITNRWIFGTFLCQLKVFLFSTHMYGSIYFLTLTSLHRYFTVVYHCKKSIFTSKLSIKKMCLGIWACLFLQGIPYFFAVKSSDVNGVPKCINVHQSDQTFSLFVANWVVLFISILIPFSIMLVCYGLLIQYIVKANSVTPLSKVIVSKSVRMIFMSLTILFICYIPSHVSRTIGLMIKMFSPTSCARLEDAEFAYYVTWVLSTLNCCMDPILYCFASNKFKYMFIKFFRLHELYERKENGEAQKTSEEKHLESLPTPSPTEIGLSSLVGQSH
ncbi:lysophosphatidic acid receptor 6-like [Mantella aurantiaca]